MHKLYGASWFKSRLPRRIAGQAWVSRFFAALGADSFERFSQNGNSRVATDQRASRRLPGANGQPRKDTMRDLEGSHGKESMKKWRARGDSNSRPSA